MAVNRFPNRILVLGILMKVLFMVNGLNAPSYTSSWYTLIAQDASQSIVTINHNLGEYPVKVDVQVKVTDNDEDYIFTGIGSAHRDDDRDGYYGGVLYAYNTVEIKLIVPINTGTHSSSSKGLSAFTGGGKFTGSTRIGGSYTTCQARVRMWKLCDFGYPSFVYQSLTMDDSSNTFKEVNHNLGAYPDVVSVQVHLDDGYVSDAQGNVFSGAYIHSFQALGGVVFGYDQNKIRLWSPTQSGDKDFNGAVFSIFDGYGGPTDWSKDSGTIKIMMWNFPAAEVVFSQTLTPFGGGIDSSPYEVTFASPYSSDDYYISVEVQANGGNNDEYRFQGAGSCMGEGSDGLGTFGGVVYVYNTQRVLLYRPADSSIGNLVYIGDRWGDGSMSQSSTTGDVIIKVFVASGNAAGACGHGTCTPDLSLLTTTCDCSTTSYTGTTCKDAPVTTCPVPSDVVNAMKQYTGVAAGSTVMYSCNQGFYLSSGNQQLTCVSGSWTGTAPTCSAFACSVPGDVDNASKSLTGQTPGDTVTYTCLAGYALTSGSSIHTCVSGAAWSGSSPVCEAPVSSCSVPPDVGNAVKQYTGTLEGATVLYSCDQGYHLSSGHQQLTCTSGSWIGTTPVCSMFSCTVPKDIDYATKSMSGRTPGDTVTYICQPGYSLTSGNSSRTCFSGATWSGSSPVCEASVSTCPVPSDLSNAVKLYTGVVEGATVMYSCNHSYYLLSGDQQLICTSGSWTGTTPVCSPFTSVAYIPNTQNTTLEVKLQKLRKETEIAKNSTSSYRRSLISVYDSRPSCMYIGSVGVVMMCLVLAFMVFADSGRVLKAIFCKNEE